MKLTDRDQLLSRLEERSHNTYNLVEKIEHHMAEQNDAINKHAERIATNEVEIKGLSRGQGRLWKVVFVLIGLGGSAFGVSQWFSV